MIYVVVTYLIIGYIIISILAFTTYFTNFTLIDKRKAHIPFKPYEQKMFNGIAYWKCYNPKTDPADKWVIMLHGWWRSSSKMIFRGETYWKNGYSILFIDARGHGLSKFTIKNNGSIHANDVFSIVQKEKLPPPLIHGLSFGAATAYIYALQYPVKALVLEALALNFRLMFKDYLRYKLKLPKFLFGWMTWLYLRQNYDWEGFSPEHTIHDQKFPMFLIQGEDDSLFKPYHHYYPLLQKLTKNPFAKGWLVPNALHSTMDRHKDYKSQLRQFLNLIGNFERLNEEISIKSVK